MLERRAEFSPGPASVTEARSFVRQALVGWDAEAWEYGASALVTELATNAVLHARTPFVVEVSYDGRQVRLCVSDGDRRPPLRKSHSRESTTGRGLDLVGALSDAWGVDQQATGKTIWCRVSSDARALVMKGESSLLDSGDAIVAEPRRQSRVRQRTLGEKTPKLAA